MLEVRHLRDLHVDPTAHPRGQTHLSAASGLVRIDERLYVVADDEHHLGVFDLAPERPGQLIRLFEGDLPDKKKKRKALKPDIESLVHIPTLLSFQDDARDGGRFKGKEVTEGNLGVPPWRSPPERSRRDLLGLGSGSRPNRNTGVLMSLTGDGGVHRVRHVDLTPLYAPLRRDFSDLNIEGAVLARDELLLLQRGNKGDSSNACIRFAWPQVLPWLLGRSAVAPKPAALQHYELGEVDGIPLCFTDGAALPTGGWVFSAVAENVEDSYADGACAGAAIGIIDGEGTLRSIRALPRGYKVEGIAAHLEGDALTLTMVTDADDPEIASQVLSAQWSLSEALGGAPDSGHRD
jgi:hypothetical protein